VILEF